MPNPYVRKTERCAAAIRDGLESELSNLRRTINAATRDRDTSATVRTTSWPAIAAATVEIANGPVATCRGTDHQRHSSFALRSRFATMPTCRNDVCDSGPRRTALTAQVEHRSYARALNGERAQVRSTITKHRRSLKCSDEGVDDRARSALRSRAPRALPVRLSARAKRQPAARIKTCACPAKCSADNLSAASILGADTCGTAFSPRAAAPAA
jgi:hypothetical protein